MKTSNKILLILFLLPFLAVALGAFKLNSIFKKGEYITEAEYNKKTIVANSLPNFTDINLLNYKGRNVRIEKNNNYMIGIEENNLDKISYAVQNNILEISSKTNESISLVIYCPEFSTLITDSALVDIKDNLKFTTVNAKPQSDIYIESNLDSLNLNIERDGNVNLLNSNIQLLNLHLVNGANLNINEATISKLGSISVEDSVKLNIGGKALMSLINQKSSTQQ